MTLPSTAFHYEVSRLSKSALYDALEPQLNAGEVELLDDGKLQEQLLTLVQRGGKIDHQPGDHDDYANAAAGAIEAAHGKPFEQPIVAPMFVSIATPEMLDPTLARGVEYGRSWP